MRYFPINLDIRGKTAVVVGGGNVSARKCLSLLAAGALVRVVSPSSEETLLDMASEGRISIAEREFRAADLDGAAIAFAATGDVAADRLVADEANRRGIPVNVAGSPELGTFTMPASVSRGDLLVTISTGGKSPLLSAELRKRLSMQLGPEYAPVLELLGAVREKLLTEKGSAAYNKQILHALVSGNLPELFAGRAYAEIDRLLIDLIGPGYSLAGLGVREKDSE